MSAVCPSVPQLDETNHFVLLRVLMSGEGDGSGVHGAREQVGQLGAEGC